MAKAIPPDYALGSHVAALGLTFCTGTSLPARYRGGAFIGEHGSWDRYTPSGRKVVFVPFRNGRPAGKAVDIVTGCRDAKRGRSFGRSVGVAVDRIRRVADRRGCREHGVARDRGRAADNRGNGPLTGLRRRAILRP